MNSKQLSPGIEILDETDEIVINDNGKKTIVKIERQLMQLLLLMTECEGQLVEKETFITRIWDGNNLTGEPALTKNIFKLREVFKNNHIENRLEIETIPKKGYRLLVKTDHSNTIKWKLNYSRPVFLSLTILVLAVVVIVNFRHIEVKYENPQVIITHSKDSVILLGKEKVQVIDTDSTTDQVIKPAK